MHATSAAHQAAADSGKRAVTAPKSRASMASAKAPLSISLRYSDLGLEDQQVRPFLLWMKAVRIDVGVIIKKVGMCSGYGIGGLQGSDHLERCAGA